MVRVRTFCVERHAGSKMFLLKTLKTLQHVSTIIQIILRELECSLLKSLILKFVKNVKSQCGDAAA